MVFELIQREPSDVFEVSSPAKRSFATSGNFDTISLLPAAKQSLTNPERLRRKSVLCEIHKDGAQFVTAFQAIFSNIRRINESLFALSRVTGFLDYKMMQSKLFKFKIEVLDTFPDGMRLPKGPR